MKYTGEYFLAEYHKFRNVMCSRRYDSNQKLLGFKGLWAVFLRISKDDEQYDVCAGVFDALFVELPRRLSYEAVQPLTELLLNNHAGKTYRPAKVKARMEATK